MATWTSAAYVYSNAGSIALSTAEAVAWATRTKETLDGCGLVQTADTGQLVPANATWPGATGAMGYFVYRFNDAQQGTDPVFLKVILGRGATQVGCTSISFQFGQGSNGSGTLTGFTSPTYTGLRANGGAASTVDDYACHTDNHFFYGSQHLLGGSTVFALSLAVERHRNTAGTYTGTGLSILYQTGGGLYLQQSIRWTATTFTGTAGYSFCLVPGLPSPAVGSNGDRLLYPHFYHTPEIFMRRGSFTVKHSDFPTNPTTFTATPIVAEGQHTFLHPGAQSGVYGAANLTANTSYGAAFLWE